MLKHTRVLDTRHSTRQSRGGKHILTTKHTVCKYQPKNVQAVI